MYTIITSRLMDHLIDRSLRIRNSIEPLCSEPSGNLRVGCDSRCAINSIDPLLTQGLELPPLRAAEGRLLQGRRPTAGVEMERLVLRRPRGREPGGRLRRRPEQATRVVVREVRELAAPDTLE
jgi:hypothetical protein